MKILKIVVGALILLLIAVLLLGLVMPKNFTVERSTVIDASKEAIFPYVQEFEKIDEWSPWAKLDPDMKTEITGTDGEVGTTYAWVGNDKVGTGSQTITKVTENEEVNTQIVFKEPFDSKADAYMRLADADGGTKVTWGFDSSMPYPMNVMLPFMNMEESVGNDYAKGLASLKTIIESQPKAPTYEVSIEDFSGKIFLAFREEVPMDKVSEHMETHMPRLAAAMTKNNIKMAGSAVGLFYKWDEANKMADMAEAIPVGQKVKLKGFENIELPAGRALVVEHYGDYAGTEAAHYALEDYMQKNGMKALLPVLEEYVTDPQEEPNSEKWLTRIIYLIDEKEG